MENPSALQAPLTVGGGHGLSLSTVPTISQSPKDLLLKQWRSAYNLGLALGPPAGVLACGTLGYASYAKYNVESASAAWKGLVFAALSIVPFIWVFLLPTNATLLAECDKKAGQGTMTEAEVKDVVARWGNINLVRGLLPLISVSIEIDLGERGGFHIDNHREDTTVEDLLCTY